MTSKTPDFAKINEQALELARRATTSGRGGAASDAIEVPPGHVVFSAISGGHMYGFPSPDSDLDIRGCHVLPVAEVITKELWGVADTPPYMHDGRATTLTEAILWHGGEGRQEREAFEALSTADQSLVIEFLESLRTLLHE